MNTQEKVAEIDRLKKSGMSTRGAADKIGWTTSAYYAARYDAKKRVQVIAKKPKRRRKVEVQTVELQPTGKIAVILVSPQELGDLLKRLP